MRKRADELKKKVRTQLGTCEDIVGTMNLVDAIQHLGIEHLFKQEIDNTLRDIRTSEFTSSSLHEVALWFRLLREHGLWVSPDVFGKFDGDDARLSSVIADHDTRGLLSLYNAAHLLVHGEPELEEAISIARHHLESMTRDCDLNPVLANQVNRALNIALPRTCKRLETSLFISEYEQEEGWWRDLYTYVGLNYARDRAVEGYLWSCLVFYEKDLSFTRTFVAKMILLVTLMDDTFDSHATIQECRQLNSAIQRWDESAVTLLPEYLKKFYRELLRNFKVLQDQVTDNDKYRVTYTRKEFQKLSTYYLQEAEWSHQRHKPSFGDQITLTAMSSVIPLLCVSGTVGMGYVTKETFEWVASRTTAIVASAKIGRFMNDIAAMKRGKNKGDVASSVECYMNEHKVTMEVAIDKIDSLVEDEWRTLNQARFEDHKLFPVVEQVVNLTASMALFYDERKDAYTFATLLQDTIESLFVNPVPI
uniref:Terpene synthase n=1 Tax=Oryza glumipatula TaxID=40148 RepID=A0A0D9ZJ50_9ORYZ